MNSPFDNAQIPELGSMGIRTQTILSDAILDDTPRVDLILKLVEVLRQRAYTEGVLVGARIVAGGAAK
jgi:hypothetical protein